MGSVFQSNLKELTKGNISGYELTYQTLHRLNEFELTATAKLVLVFLTTHFNVEKNGAVVFPSISHISETLGIGQTATKQAIKDLISQGLIFKSKLNKSGNHNKYVITSKVQNPTFKSTKSDFFKRSDSDRFMIEQVKGTNKKTTKEIKKNETKKNVVALKKISSKRHSIELEEVPEIIKTNKKVKNPCAYWASLSEEVKKEYLKKEAEIQATTTKVEEKKKEEIARKIKEKEEREKAKEMKQLPLEQRYSREEAVQLVKSLKRLPVKSRFAESLVSAFGIKETEIIRV